MTLPQPPFIEPCNLLQELSVDRSIANTCPLSPYESLLPYAAFGDTPFCTCSSCRMSMCFARSILTCRRSLFFFPLVPQAYVPLSPFPYSPFPFPNVVFCVAVDVRLYNRNKACVSLNRLGMIAWEPVGTRFGYNSISNSPRSVISVTFNPVQAHRFH